MKILAIDYGNKRLGLALGDTNLKIASPFKVIENRGDIWQKIRSIVEEHQVSVVLVGLPLTPRGNLGLRAKQVEEFVKNLKENLPEDIDIITWDERYTTREAYWLLENLPASKRKKLKDSVSAYVILKEYLETL
ncbi:Holliday junction resolvase RuvX [Hydrogenobacter hydrogenophilus]|uniref:Putative pre-16S rRNA nuclease n=1 Tax=Hydrogenobacter hydrogenophilus TaxID=35835 RepID=A0A285NZG5_9AQUI|nr:Holliday junction resolvase RuvX [Hydrogenobacter hydrogenophilus]SNZ14417.1 putative holliday junction resolvase [Hydrogenobacter hydrogenophilus]